MSRRKAHALPTTLIVLACSSLLLGEEAIAQETAADVLAAWRERAASLQSARFSWTEEHVVQPGGFISPTLPESLNPEGISFPEEETTFATQHSLSIDGGMMRHSLEGDHPHPIKGLVRRDYLSVYDGQMSKTYRARENARSHAQGAILDERRNADVNTVDVEAILMNYRVLQDRMSPVRPSHLPMAALDEGVVDINGHNCRRLSAEQRHFWVDVDRDWLIVRFDVTFSQNATTQRQLDINYRDDPEHGWVPSGWTMSRFIGSGDLQWSFEANVTEYEINPQIPETEFQFAFPAGTLVQDQRNGDQYEVQ